MTATFYVGDALEVMAKLPEKSVDLVLSSPPFLALRSYLPSDHPDKAKEGGSQATPGEYIDWLVDVAEACARVLAPHGSLCFELGDTYAGGGQGPDAKYTAKADQVLYHPTKRGLHSKNGWPLDKSLSLIPELFRFTLVYGFNPLTGRQTERWRLRNVIRWVRPNPPVGALGDKFRPATSELMVFCKSAKRYFDLDAVREPGKPPLTADGRERGPTGWPNSQKKAEVGLDSGSWQTRIHPGGAPPLDWWQVPDRRNPCVDCGGNGVIGTYSHVDAGTGEHLGDEPIVCPSCAGSGDWWEISLLDDEAKPYGPKDKPAAHPRNAKGVAQRPNDVPSAKRDGGNWSTLPITDDAHPLGSPPLDWWNIPPGGYEGAHYAVWPPELCVRPIKAMCPEQVCRTCGEPRRRIVGDAEYVKAGKAMSGLPATYFSLRTGLKNPGVKPGSTSAVRAIPGAGDGSVTRSTPTLGFSDCGHNNYRAGVVLDPFAGSGTTLAVATGHGREAIGVDLDERNYGLALERVGPMFLERGDVET